MANLPLPILFPSSVLIILIFLCILRRMVLGGVGGMHQIFSIVKLLQGSLCGEVSSCLNVRVFLFSFLIFFYHRSLSFPTAAWQSPTAPCTQRDIVCQTMTWGLGRMCVSRAEAGAGGPAVTSHGTGVKPVTPSSGYGQA